ncbi:MAG: ferredoxin [Actinomycetota bacterium]
MSRRIVIDAGSCVMSGECIYNHPDHFDWSEDGSVAEVLRSVIEGEDDLRHGEQAAEVCPGAAISVVDG